MPIDERGNTLLHYLAIHGNYDAIKEVIGQVSSNKELKKQNIRGGTALHEAATCGHRNVAEILLKKESSSASIRNNLGETALYLAAACGNKRTFKLLEEFSNIMMSRDDRCTVLHTAVMGQYYRMAFTIVKSYPCLAHKHNSHGETTLYLLASSPSSFRSGSEYKLSNLGIPALYIESKAKGDSEDPSDNRVVIINLKRCSFSDIFCGLYPHFFYIHTR